MRSSRERLRAYFDMSPLNKSAYSMELLDAGTINTNARVTTDKNVYLCKLFANNTKLAIDRKRQYALQDMLSKYALSPKPLYLSDDQCFYVEEWVSVGIIQSTECSIEALAKTQFRIHQMPTEDLASLDLIANWQLYMQHIRVDSELLALSNQLTREWQVYLGNKQEALVLCHHDLHTDHLSGEGNICFDWEYAALNCAYFDLACTILSNGFEAQEKQSFLNAYAKQASISPEKIEQHVATVMPFVKFTNELWYLANN